MPTVTKPCCVKRAKSKNPRYCEFCGAPKEIKLSAGAPQLQSRRDSGWVNVFLPHMRLRVGEHRHDVTFSAPAIMRRRLDLAELRAV